MIHEFERSKDGRRVKSSGTSLLAEHYVNYLEQGRALMEFVEAVRSWDTYDWKINGNPLSRKLKAVLDAYGKKKLIQNMSTVIYEHPNDEIILDTSLVLYELELEKRYIEEVLNQNSIFPGKYKGHNIAFYVTTNAKYVSEVSYQFLEKNLDIDVFITVDLGRETVTYVTQSDDIDTAAIFAVPLGGGGHPKSSGSPLPFSFVKGLSTLLIKTWNVQI
jgi:oligoribonuclease NrnB/cAMP/cGMP phosphodiesterase (DHH superfamily)